MHYVSQEEWIKHLLPNPILLVFVKGVKRDICSSLFFFVEGFVFWAKVAVLRRCFMLPFGMMMHTFSPGEPRGPASPGRPERPFGPSGPSSPRGPDAPSSPWKIEETGRTTESFIDAFKKKKKKITCVLWCPKIYPNIKQYKTTHQQILSWLHHLWCSGFKPWLFLACYQQSVQSLEDIKYWCWIYILRNPKCLYQGSKIKVIKSLLTYLIPFSGVT